MKQNKKWFRVSVACDETAFEAVSNFLFEQGAEGVEEQETMLIGYYNGDLDISHLKKQSVPFIQSMKELGLSVREMIVTEQPFEDWSIGWRDYFHPISISERIVIKPPWEAWDGPQPIVIDIMPRMAFGTGSHETTQICLGFLEKHIQSGNHVLDVGTGSGILAIAAVKLGAQCIAVEIDVDALENTRENAAHNNVADKIEIYQGSLEAVPNVVFNLIVANINRKVLMEMIPEMVRFCREDTKVILSGILIVDKQLIMDKLQEVGFSVIDHHEYGEWMGIVAEVINN
ncbi:50S ribosomal protein L11 methyltransferase [bacterium]